jgi:AcrR family transcriptional regulator
MPKLWHDTIQAHRRGVRDAILATTAALVAEHGLRAVTMSQVAAATGIGRATLYKYFPDVEAILVAWHDRHVADHLHHLAGVRDEARDPAERLDTVLRAYAQIVFARPHGTELATLVHRDEHVAEADRQLRDFLREVLAEAAAQGAVREDVAPDELVSCCLHALAATRSLPSQAAVDRLVSVVLAGLRPPSGYTGDVRW